MATTLTPPLSAGTLDPLNAFGDSDTLERMDTLMVDAQDFESLSDEALRERVAPVVDLLREGHPVGMPTETVYGLAANALDEGAVRGIFAAKKRPADNPLIVHVGDREMFDTLVDTDAIAEHPFLEALMDAFWPGPLTVLVPRSPLVSDVVTAGHDSVGVRMPAHPVALALIRHSGLPLAAPSANLSGRPSPTRAEHVYEDLAGRIPAIVDAGDCAVGVESTVLDVRCEPPVILRPGGVTAEDIRRVVGDVSVFTELSMDKPATPGLKYTHYSPDAPVVLLDARDSGDDVVTVAVARAVSQWGLDADAAGEGEGEGDGEGEGEGDGEGEGARRGRKVGLIHTRPGVAVPAAVAECVTLVGASGDTDVVAVAKGIFRALRTLDSAGVDVIIVEGVTEAGMGAAVMNRVRKAANQIVEIQ